MSWEVLLSPQQTFEEGHWLDSVEKKNYRMTWMFWSVIACSSRNEFAKFLVPPKHFFFLLTKSMQCSMYDFFRKQSQVHSLVTLIFFLTTFIFYKKSANFENNPVKGFKCAQRPQLTETTAHVVATQISTGMWYRISVCSSMCYFA